LKPTTLIFMQTSLTFSIWLYSTIVGINVVLWPRYASGDFPTSWSLAYVTVCFCVLFLLLRTLISDPGRVTKASVARYCAKYKTKELPKMEFCAKCELYRPARAHHCQKCGCCVLRMDHHCAFINNCVGDRNQWLFSLLLFYALIMGVVGLRLLIWDLSLPSDPPPTSSSIITQYITRHKIVYSLLVLSIIIILAVAGLLLVQQANMYNNTTTLELLMLKAGRVRDLEYDHTNTYESVCGYYTFPLCWLWPCRADRRDLLVDEVICEVSSYSV